jgi:hypothetical protein
MRERMTAFGLTGAIGEDNIFTTEDRTFGSARAAVCRARELLGCEPSADSVDTDSLKQQRPAVWSYDI